ncbi:hypothetical protein P8452_59748 [Trifolium repens]|nr:hypothetical protein P8452_59748 [Trifolium repens]
MAASSSSSRNVTIYAVDDAEPIIVDGSTFVSEPDMTSVEDTIWGEELMIPHKLRDIEKETENSVSDPPVEDQPSTHVETPSTEGPILEKINPNLQDPGTQGDNEEQPTAPFNNDEGHTKENNECHEAGGSNPCSRCISREG